MTNLADATWVRDERAGVFCTFEADDAHFADFGINVHVVEPGQANGLYHAESVQEAFLVLHGECTLLVEGQERRLVSGDFFHCPAGVWHVIVGGGEGPCAILMVGRREPGKTINYAPNEVAARYGASAKVETDQPRVAYADWPDDRHADARPVALPLARAKKPRTFSAGAPSEGVESRSRLPRRDEERDVRRQTILVGAAVVALALPGLGVARLAVASEGSGGGSTSGTTEDGTTGTTEDGTTGTTEGTTTEGTTAPDTTTGGTTTTEDRPKVRPREHAGHRERHRGRGRDDARRGDDRRADRRGGEHGGRRGADDPRATTGAAIVAVTAATTAAATTTAVGRVAVAAAAAAKAGDS